MARAFYKMSGSGNDFVFFETIDGAGEGMSSPEAVRTLCARGTGVGADGVVFLQRKTSSLVAISYYNSDGSLGELCGNATLCAARLAHDLDLVTPGDMGIDTDSGTVTARMTDGLPEIDLAPVSEVAVEVAAIERLPGELTMGFARVGVPHIVVVVEDIEVIDVLGRGSQIRRDRSLRDGANVNFLAAGTDGTWRVRTYERGVEGETLACGTGAVAAAILLVEWGRAKSPVLLETRSGKNLEVSIRREGERWYPSLRGNADLVFTGHLGLIFEALHFRPTPSGGRRHRMTIAQSLLGEFDHEMENTRRVLERVPLDRADWKPHPKSFSLGILAIHTAELAQWAAVTINQSELDFSPEDGQKVVRATADTSEELMALFERNRVEARTALEGASDATMMGTWTLKNSGHVIFSMPRVAVLRGFVMNHMIHHRGQLTVYLRLNDIAVPGIYGPSADEPM